MPFLYLRSEDLPGPTGFPGPSGSGLGSAAAAGRPDVPDSLFSTLANFMSTSRSAPAAGSPPAPPAAPRSRAAPDGPWRELPGAMVDTKHSLNHTDVHRLAVRVTAAPGGKGACVTVESGLPVEHLLHWGVVPRGGRSDVWAVPPAAMQPEGSTEYKERACQTVFPPPPVQGAPTVLSIPISEVRALVS